jgi:hypothetical protein
MSDSFNPPNSIWPNGLKKDDGGYIIFYPSGSNKIDISDIIWPQGNKLISRFVYDSEDKIVGFCDTKAMVTSGLSMITLDYSVIDTSFPHIDENDLIIHAPNATVKKIKWKPSRFIVGFKYKNCTTVEDVKKIDSNYISNDIVDGAWSESLKNLTDGTEMFYAVSGLHTFNANLTNLNNGNKMFYDCKDLTLFTDTNLYNLSNGSYMFRGTNLSAFDAILDNLTHGSYMFYLCKNLTSFNNDLYKLRTANSMFRSTKLHSFSANLDSLNSATNMFSGCSDLTSFSSGLSSLERAPGMFSGCKLDTDSVSFIANTINTLKKSAQIDIGIANSTPNETENEAFLLMKNKGWDVYVNGSDYFIEEESNLNTLDEHGEKDSVILPFYAKPILTTEDEADFVDENGNFYRIVGGQFIYVNDPETYGMFTSLEDAAANMRLSKYEKLPL